VNFSVLKGEKQHVSKRFISFIRRCPHVAMPYHTLSTMVVERFNYREYFSCVNRASHHNEHARTAAIFDISFFAAPLDAVPPRAECIDDTFRFLSNGDAGKVVETFGSFVVGGKRFWSVSLSLSF
jgi:hypothetical protein